ncbi:MAG: PorT family protein [Alloprevotella sp.]|nr:PorT family protein [Alloprevotella sp.]
MTTATTRTRARRLLLCLLLALPAGLHAQLGEPRSALKYGFGAGLAMNSVGFTPSIKQKLHLGPTIGIVGRLDSEMYFKTLCSLQAELNLTQLGWREEILNAQTQPLPDRYSRHLYYLQLPFLAHLAWGREAHGLAGFLNLGPQVGVLLGEGTSQSAQWTLNAEGNPDRPNNRFAQYTMDVEHRIDYGIMAGAGIEWHTRAGHFALEGRYYYGLADIYGNSKKDVFARSNHSTVSIRLSYLMGK